MASSSSSMEELTTTRTTSLLLPWIIGMAAGATNSAPHEIAVFLHHPTQSITVIEGNLDVESILREIPTKELGHMPASRTSIDSLPRVSILEPGLECPICLVDMYEDVDGDGEVKEMPCGHRFHSDCIDKWLVIRGSCPVCRFSMPVEMDSTTVEEEWRIHVVFGQEGTYAGRVRDPDPGNGANDEIENNYQNMDHDSD